jgi:hypothetical protein
MFMLLAVGRYYESVEHGETVVPIVNVIEKKVHHWFGSEQHEKEAG